MAELDAAEPLVDRYLAVRQALGDTPATLKTIRSALRMLYRLAYPAADREACVRALGAAVPLPRRREDITPSRHVVGMDTAIALERYQPLVAFCRATGVRRRELAALVVGDVRANADGSLVIHVACGKGGKGRCTPVVPGQEAAVRAPVLHRGPDERIFARIPIRLDIQSYRRAYAQALYCEQGRRALPAPTGRLRPGTVDAERVLYVSRALGHERVDVTLRHYLR